MKKINELSELVVNKKLKTVRSVIEKAEELGYQFNGPKEQENLTAFATDVTEQYRVVFKSGGDTVGVIANVLGNYFTEIEQEEEVQEVQKDSQKQEVLQETLFVEPEKTNPVTEDTVFTVETLCENLSLKFKDILETETEIDKEHESFKNFQALMEAKGTYRKNKSEDDVLEVVNRAVGKKARDLEGKLALVNRQFGGLINLQKNKN